MGVKLITLSCNQCGAPLSAPEGARYLTCAHCTSRLLIEYTGDAYYTTVLDRVEKHITETDKQVELMKLQLEIERCEREWQTTQDRYVMRFPDGTRVGPEEAHGSRTAHGIVAFGLLSVFTLILMMVGGRDAKPVAIFMVFLYTVSAIMFCHQITDGRQRVREYRKAQASYRTRMKDLRKRIQTLREPIKRSIFTGGSYS